MAEDDGGERAPDQGAAAARSVTQLAEQMREMAERMLSGGLPGWPVATPPAGRPDPDSARSSSGTTLPGPSEPGGLPAIPGMPTMPGLPATPVTLSARQLQAIVDDIAARRSQVRALVAQLEAFDEQLGTLETSLRPLLQWLRTWADLEGTVTDFWTPRPPGP